MKETICKLWREGQTLKNRETTQDTLTRGTSALRFPDARRVPLS